MAEGILQKVEDELNCRICLDRYEDPKLLQCFHVYCKKCLVRLVDRDAGGQLVLTCPECRQVTSVPAGKVANLKSAFYINRLLGIIQEEHKNEKQFCSEHVDEELKLYCTTCEKFICYKCGILGSKHHEHIYEEPDKAFKKYKEVIGSSQKLVENQMENIRRTLEEVESHCCKINDRLLSEDNGRIQLLSHLHETIKSKLRRLKNQDTELKLYQAKLRSCLDFMKATSMETDVRQVLEMKTSVIKRIRQLTIPVPPHLLKLWARTDEIPPCQVFKGEVARLIYVVQR